jgi:uncharacterized protein (TIGR03435 family)
MKAVSLPLFLSAGVFAQNFEVASVKAAPPPDMRGMFVRVTGGPGSKDPGRWTAENFSLSNLVTTAYGINYYQLNAPTWLNTERFNITATVPEGAKKEDLKVMVQHLLEERFKLAVHRDSIEMMTYELVVGKGGPKFKEAVETPPDGAPPAGPPDLPKLDKDGYPQMERSGMSIMNNKARSRQTAGTMAQLVSMLGAQLAAPVTDATSLTGKYDYTLSWSAAAMRPNASADADDTGPTLFIALQEQLGLKLEQKKEPVEIIVVDHIEKTPTEN